MSEDNAKETTVPEPEQNETIKPKKSRFKLHLTLTLILGIGTWVFWTYSPKALQLKQQWFTEKTDIAPAQRPTVHSDPSFQTIEPQTSPVQKEPLEQPNIETTSAVPLFEPTPEVNLSLALDHALEHEESDQPNIQVGNLAALTDSIQNMQQQIMALQKTIIQMHAQQLQQAQQYVRAQLFSDLQQAASPRSDIESAISAWKSISLMPLLSAEKRTFATQAYTSLQTVQRNKQNISLEITSWIDTLSQQLQVDEPIQEENADTNAREPIQHTDILNTGLAWLKKQFQVSKAIEAHNQSYPDAYASIKQLVINLHQLQHDINAKNIEIPTDLANIFYQLEQHGIETAIPTETILGLEETQQAWKTQAQTWMEQL